jgi:hypothetical protein
MRDFCSLIWCAVVGLFRSRVALQAEILVLRHQLNVLRRKSPRRVALGNIDRAVLIGLYRLAPKVLEALKIIAPETVIQLDELGEVRQGPGQTVDLVDNDDVNLACPYVLQQSLQGRPVDVATREAAIVVFATQEGPASVSLASDIGLRGIILGIE